MNALLRRAPVPAPITWADAPAYRANGYCPIAVELSQIAEGREQPCSGGWAWGHGEIAASRHGENGVGILCGRLPRGSVGLDECQTSWIAALRIDVHTDGKLVRDIERLIEPGLRWADGITTRYAPVRTAPNSKALLMPFRLEARDPRDIYGITRHFTAPADRPNDSRYNCVSIASSGVCFAASGFLWRNDLDLRAVPRAALPLMSADDARDIIDQCKALIDERT